MNRIDFGALVKSLRTERFNAAAGRSWTQYDLAEAASLTSKIISDIECGRRAHLDGETLLRLADALGLNTLERCAFFALATEVDLEEVPAVPGAAERRAEALLATLETMWAPGMLHDSLYNIIGMNSPWMRFHPFTLSRNSL